MKKGLLVFALVSTALLMQGCVVIRVEEEDAPCRPGKAVEPRSATIEEIDAVSELAFNTDRTQRYEQLARREGLSERAQVHLIEATFEHLAFNNDKVAVLLTLIGNPSFAPAAKAAILDHLDQLAFDNDKRKILDALDG